MRECGRQAGALVHKAGFSWRLALTLLLGGLGAALAQRYHLPGGMIIGAMAITGAASLLGAPLVNPPSWMRRVARIVLGLTIGATVTLATLRTVAAAMGPVLLIIVAMVGAGLLVARIIHRVTGMSLATAFSGAAPGVLSAMVALAEDLGGDGPVVASLHLVRLVSIMLLIPSLARAFFEPAAAVALTASGPAETAGFWPLAVLLVVGIAGGLLATRTGVPAGDLLASLAIAAVLNAAWIQASATPVTWRIFAQWVIGSGLGASISRKTLRAFQPFAVAGLTMTAFFLAAGLALAWLLWRLTGLDPVTCLVASAAGGAETMIILAGELGGDVPLVTAVHVTRQILILLVVPFLARGALRGNKEKTPGVQENP